jgi:endonuclease YncB( thermonuclease family)
MTTNKDSQPSEQLLEAVEEIAAILQGLSPKDLQVIDLHGLHFISSPLPNGAKEFSVWGIVDYLIFVREANGFRHIKKYIKADWEPHISKILSSCRRAGIGDEAKGYWGTYVDLEYPLSDSVDGQAGKALPKKALKTPRSGRRINWSWWLIGLLVIVVAGSLGYFASTGWRLHGTPTMANVSRVIDGDTIEVSIDGDLHKIRYIGIDTPETVDPQKLIECFGKEASDKNRSLVEGKTVRLEKDVSETDQYGRLLRYVWIGDTMINAELVRLGYAQVSTYPPDVKYQDLFLRLQTEAGEAERGLWGKCKCDITSRLEIIEIHYNGAVSRVESDEYVVIQNIGNQSQNLAGWVLEDVSDGSPSFTFPYYILAPCSTIRVYTNEIHSQWGGFSFGYGSAVWNNEQPDTAALFDCKGREVSNKSYRTGRSSTAVVIPPKTETGIITPTPNPCATPTPTPRPTPTSTPTPTPTTTPALTQTLVPLPTTVFTYSASGTVNTPPFDIGTSPWKLQFSTNWSGFFGVLVKDSTFDIVVNQSVSAGVIYETYVYGHTGNGLYFSISTAPLDGLWTLSVIEHP